MLQFFENWENQLRKVFSQSCTLKMTKLIKLMHIIYEYMYIYIYGTLGVVLLLWMINQCVSKTFSAKNNVFLLVYLK